MKKEVIIIFLIVFTLSFVNAGDALLTTERSSNINLYQGCDASSYSNITRIVYDKTSLVLLDGETVMVQSTNNNYNYTFNDTTRLGVYKVYGHCDENGIDETWWYDFEVTPSGNSGSSNIAFFIFSFILFYGLNLFGFFGRNIPLTVLSGMALMFLGIYTITNGVVIYQNNLTNYIAYVTIAWGFISSIWAALEQFDVLD